MAARRSFGSALIQSLAGRKSARFAMSLTPLRSAGRRIGCCCGQYYLAGRGETRYVVPMVKDIADNTLTVRDPKTGKLVTVRGAGALKDHPLSIMKGVDLTKPIAAQVLRLERKRRVRKG
jgi:hypothetical protein